MARRGDAETVKPQDVTKRVVLHGGPAIMLPHDLTEEQRKQAYRAVRDVLGRAQEGLVGLPVVWVEVGEVEAATMARAIDEKAGRPGTADAKVRLWKAPALRSWLGGRRHMRPPEPLIQAEAL